MINGELLNLSTNQPVWGGQVQTSSNTINATKYHAITNTDTDTSYKYN